MGGHSGAGPKWQGDWVLVASPEPVDYPQADGPSFESNSIYTIVIVKIEGGLRLMAPDSAQAIWPRSRDLGETRQRGTSSSSDTRI
jgi:hypothetical protein